MPAPVLLIAPQGLTVTGVTTWIQHVARGLSDPDAGLNRPVGVMVHGSVAGHSEVAVDLPPHVTVYRRDDLPSLDELNGDLRPIITAYRDAVRNLSHDPRCDAAVVVFPARHAECFAACCALTIVDPEAVRVVGLQQIDGAYESAVIGRYEPAMTALAGVSTRLVDQLNERFPTRRHETFRVPNAAALPHEVAAREPIDGRPIRLIYTGRIEHEQKRVNALVALSDELSRTDIDHELVVVGDGPASDDFAAAAQSRPSIRVLGAVAPDAVLAHLDHADVLVLASRTEGLSLTLLEAMAHGCCPVVTDTLSGARDAVTDGVNGVLVPFEATDDDAAVGAGLARGITRAMGLGVHELGRAAHERVRGFFSADRLARVVAEVADRAAAMAPRSWPAGRAVMFNAGDGSSGGPGEGGSVPVGGRERFAAALNALANARVVVHGVGQHTRRLADLLADPPCAIVGFTDDNPKVHGGTLFGWPVVAPAEVATLNADAVLISSAMHEASIWSRRAAYEAEGLRVHRVYG